MRYRKFGHPGKIGDIHQADADRLVGCPLDAGIMLANRGDGPLKQLAASAH